MIFWAACETCFSREVERTFRLLAKPTLELLADEFPAAF